MIEMLDSIKKVNCKFLEFLSVLRLSVCVNNFKFR